VADRNPTACPVAALAREAGILIAAHRRNDGRLLTLRPGTERCALEMADEAVMDRLAALEELAARTRARSLEGAMFQLVLAKTEVESLESLADHRQAAEAGALVGRVNGLLHSAVAAIEDATGTRREAFAGDWHLRRELDPHAAVAEALAGEGAA
jgi:hypothetical protein